MQPEWKLYSKLQHFSKKGGTAKSMWSKWKLKFKKNLKSWNTWELWRRKRNRGDKWVRESAMGAQQVKERTASSSTSSGLGTSSIRNSRTKPRVPKDSRILGSNIFTEHSGKWWTNKYTILSVCCFHSRRRRRIWHGTRLDSAPTLQHNTTQRQRQSTEKEQCTEGENNVLHLSLLFFSLCTYSTAEHQKGFPRLHRHHHLHPHFISTFICILENGSSSPNTVVVINCLAQI